MQLPSTPEARDKVATSHGLPIHNSNHDQYSKKVWAMADRKRFNLQAKYGTLDDVPPEELTNTVKEIEDEARELLRRWTVEKGERLQ